MKELYLRPLTRISAHGILAQAIAELPLGKFHDNLNKSAQR
jgi:hypothetical protein